MQARGYRSLCRTTHLEHCGPVPFVLNLFRQELGCLELELEHEEPMYKLGHVNAMLSVTVLCASLCCSDRELQHTQCLYILLASTVMCRGGCRLFWSSDKRFLEQFVDGDITTKFKPFSKFPPVYKDIAFWITDQFTENNLAEIVRGAGVPGWLCLITCMMHALRLPVWKIRPVFLCLCGSNFDNNERMRAYTCVSPTGSNEEDDGWPLTDVLE